MKRLSLYLFLVFFTLPTPSQADDIKDFQIEGMSIGDSLLDHFNKNEIKILIAREGTFFYSDGKTIDFKTHSDEPGIPSVKKALTYDYVAVTIHEKKKFNIIGIQGYLRFNDVNKCNKKRHELEIEIQNALNIKPEEEIKPHRWDKTRNSMAYNSWFFFPNNNENISINCTDWSKKLRDERKWKPNLKVSMQSAILLENLRKMY